MLGRALLRPGKVIQAESGSQAMINELAQAASLAGNFRALRDTSFGLAGVAPPVLALSPLLRTSVKQNTACKVLSEQEGASTEDPGWTPPHTHTPTHLPRQQNSPKLGGTRGWGWGGASVFLKCTTTQHCFVFASWLVLNLGASLGRGLLAHRLEPSGQEIVEGAPLARLARTALL